MAAVVKTTRIGFRNGIRDDETEFDTRDNRELFELWWTFCLENRLIHYVEHGEEVVDDEEC